ncbi:hypothetical protein AAFF_G00108440 [Aldrovandia affinis]|uniref:Uncharacterized protein n=1 Tax=Aldrovandia affinis TaxID=143900 RepID=A0AAD7RU58_9TELE|nr:hypothetical protein AAFF_G00108440 [Aldrovandia affinis]
MTTLLGRFRRHLEEGHSHLTLAPAFINPARHPPTPPRLRPGTARPPDKQTPTTSKTHQRRAALPQAENGARNTRLIAKFGLLELLRGKVTEMEGNTKAA